jgi:hypothetical protein
MSAIMQPLDLLLLNEKTRMNLSIIFWEVPSIFSPNPAMSETNFFGTALHMGLLYQLPMTWSMEQWWNWQD